MSDNLGRQFSGFLGNRVLDFNASRKVKAKTGQVKAIPLDTTPNSPELERHISEAMALANPVQKKKSMLDKFGEKLGLFE